MQKKALEPQEPRVLKQFPGGRVPLKELKPTGRVIGRYRWGYK